MRGARQTRPAKAAHNRLSSPSPLEYTKTAILFARLRMHANHDYPRPQRRRLSCAAHGPWACARALLRCGSFPAWTSVTATPQHRTQTMWNLFLSPPFRRVTRRTLRSAPLQAAMTRCLVRDQACVGFQPPIRRCGSLVKMGVNVRIKMFGCLEAENSHNTHYENVNQTPSFLLAYRFHCFV
jgi:hypothetical protein